jgi:hypothetical protein
VLAPRRPQGAQTAGSDDGRGFGDALSLLLGVRAECGARMLGNAARERPGEWSSK